MLKIMVKEVTSEIESGDYILTIGKMGDEELFIVGKVKINDKDYVMINKLHPTKESGETYLEPIEDSLDVSLKHLLKKLYIETIKAHYKSTKLIVEN